MNEQKRMMILREVAIRADTDAFYTTAEELGRKAAEGLSERKRAQISGLENIANSTLKTTDVFDFVKLRTARHHEWRKQKWGQELLSYLNDNLRRHRVAICKQLDLDEQGADGTYVHLLLIRTFIHQLAAHYEYVCMLREKQGASDEAETG